jgi:hypothetical protein
VLEADKIRADKVCEDANTNKRRNEMIYPSFSGKSKVNKDEYEDVLYPTFSGKSLSRAEALSKKMELQKAKEAHEVELKKAKEANEVELKKAKEAHEIEVVRRQKEAADLKIAEEAKAKIIAEENFKARLSTLEINLPFYTSKKTPSAELAEHDKNNWEDVTRLIKNEDSEMTTVYFVKLRSLMDDQEYFKIGITTKGVETRFKKSTQLELIEVIKVFDTEMWKAAFLEYHFLREFRLYDGLSTSIGEQRPEVSFSGYTEVVRSNSVNKISEFFSELGVYNELD